MDLHEILTAIENVRVEMYKLQKNRSFKDRLIVEKSQELDQLIAIYYEMQQKLDKSSYNN